MSAEAITIRPLLRPRFDNANLGCESLWIVDNARMLARVWTEQSRAIGMAPTEGMGDFDRWLSTQHDIEMALRGPKSRLPHGTAL